MTAHSNDHLPKVEITKKPARWSQATLRELYRHLPVHSFFLAAYPIVSLLGFNIDQIYTQDAFRSLLISLVTSAIVLIGLRLFFRNWQLAGLLTSLLVIWFFLYGRLYVPLKGISLFGLMLGRHRYLLVAWSGIVIAAAFWLTKRSRVIPNLTIAMNIFSTILICLPIIQIGAFQLTHQALPETPGISSTNPLISWTDSSPPPDIYYIVLDAYTRSDVLQEEFGIDNATFLGDLRQLGFHIPECTQSNYTRTIDSLTSTFNMRYIQDLELEITNNLDRSKLLPRLKHSEVRQQLEGLGYKTIVFKNPWQRLIWEDAAIVYKSSGAGLLSPFEYLLLRTTAARVYLDVRLSENLQLSNYTNYEDTLYALSQLPKVPAIPGPKFVFVHLVIPHSPFVFGPNGEKIDIPYDADAGNIYSEEDYKRGYIAAVSYINKRMLEIIPQLIRASKAPPMIILAGDHGTPWGESQNEVKILGAFFTPGSQSLFYETITPVNIFRVIFNTYFNGRFGLLPDKSYFSAEDGYIDLQDSAHACHLTE